MKRKQVRDIVMCHKNRPKRFSISASKQFFGVLALGVVLVLALPVALQLDKVKGNIK